MQISKTLNVLLLSLINFQIGTSESFLLTTSAAVSAISISLGFVYKNSIICQFSECCAKPWADFNQTAFKDSLTKQVYGQPLLYKLSDTINEHLNKRQPTKALAIALHGPTGTGKNYAVAILARHLFARATRSKYYHFFSATVNFPHRHLFDTYADQIHQWIRGNVSECSQSVFVFDEIDKMSHLLLDRLKPFLDYHEHINGVDYRRAIFIFLSNSGSDMIMQRMVQAKKLGKSRDEIANSGSFDHELSKYVYTNNNSALYNSALLRHHLISRFIPFLPLEREHVIGCIKDYLGTRQWPMNDEDKEVFAESVLRHLAFVPHDERFFSSAGCKRVVDKCLMIREAV